MNDTFHCSDHERLVAYLYDECDPRDRDAVAAHVAQCAACAEEIDALRATRRVLAAWAPPEASLGFQITRGEVEGRAPVPHPAALARRSADRNAVTAFPETARAAGWWRQPLPAWAQVAAAAVIFAAGVMLGSARSGSVPPAAPQTARAVAPSAPATTTTPVSAVSRDDLARLERRLVAMESAARSASRAPVAARAALDEDALLARVRELIAASEQRQLLAVGNLAGHVEQQRRALLAVDDRVAQIQGQSNAVNSLIRGVSFQPVGVR